MPEHARAPEQRTIDVDVSDLDTRGRTVVGHAAVFGALSEDLGGYRERIAPGAFSAVLAGAPDVRCLLNHDPSRVLARTRAGTLRLAEDETGLRFEADLPSSPTGDDLREAVRRGDLDGASFRFVVGEETWEADTRTIGSVKELQDVSLASYPAYPTASVELRARPNQPAPPEESTSMDTQDAPARPGTLTVTERSASSEGPSVEARVMDALRSVRRGESRDLTTATAEALTPPELSSFLFDALRPSSVALRSGIRVVSTDRESISFPQLTSDVVPSWVAETAVIPEGDPGFATLTATPRKLAHRVQFSNEVIDDSEPPALEVVRRHLATVLGLMLDASIFQGSGVAPVIRGLVATPGITTLSQGANGAALVSLDPIAAAIAALESANASAGAIVMHPRTWASIRVLKDADSRYMLQPSPTQDATPRLFGVPVYVTSQLSVAEVQGTATNASSVYVYAPGELVLVRRRDVTLELDRSRLFDRDMSELRGKLRADLLVPNPGAVVRIVGVRP